MLKTVSQLIELNSIVSHFHAPFSIKCISLKANAYRITFNHGYIESLPKRIKDWIDYFSYEIDCLFDPKLRHTGIKPLHFKRSCMPIDETLLELRLTANGYKIVEEYLRSTSTAYDVIKV